MDALCLAAHGGDEAFLGGDVGVEEDALQAGVSAAFELRFGDHAYGEVGAVAAPIVQFGDAEAVEIGAAVVQILVMRRPLGFGIVGDAGGG